MLNAALAYARCGWSVFPLPPGRKIPIIEWKPYQTKRASETQIRRWWNDCPNANIAIATGEVSGIFVLDFDFHFPIGEHTTYTVDSGAGGTHYYYQMPDFHIGNRVGIVPDVDIRGNGGYIVAAPSLHPEGGRYRVRSRLAVADAPDFLLRLLRKKTEELRTPQAETKTFPAQSAVRGSRYAQWIFDREYCNVTSVPEGQRNNQLNRSAYNLGQLIGDGLLNRFDVENALLQGALSVGLSERDALATIASGLNAGVGNPRSMRGK